MSTGPDPRQTSNARVTEQERRLTTGQGEEGRAAPGNPTPLFFFLDSSFRGGVGPPQPGKRGVEGLAGPLLGQADLLADLLERRPADAQLDDAAVAAAQAARAVCAVDLPVEPLLGGRAGGRRPVGQLLRRPLAVVLV